MPRIPNASANVVDDAAHRDIWASPSATPSAPEWIFSRHGRHLADSTERRLEKAAA